MICPDCEMEVIKLNTAGICHQCAIRKNNVSYQNRKNGTNKPYVKLKDLKGTKEYNRVMGRRLAESNKNSRDLIKSKPKNVSIIKSTYQIKENKSNTNMIKDLINKDLEKYYKDLNINPKDNFIPLEIIFEWFYGLCQQSNYIDDLLTKKKIFDNLIVNALHELKNPQDYPDFYAVIGEKIALIQKQRTPIDNEYEKYKQIEPIFNYLRENKDFINLLSTCRVNLLDMIEKIKDPKYITDAPSMQHYDFTISPTNNIPLKKLNTEKIKIRYYFKIKRVKYLYGNPNYQEFIYSSNISADNENEAKTKFIEYIRRDFPNLVFNTKDIVISTIPFVSTKECS